MLVVQGGPGTGKTVVALHRAAYLLYTHRFPLEGQGVLVVGPNRLFLGYIEQVLPSLGEAGVELVVLADLLDGAGGARRRGPRPPDAGPREGRPAHGQGAGPGRARPPAAAAPAAAGRLRRCRRSRLTPGQSKAIVADAKRRFRLHNAGRRHVEASVYATLADSARVPVEAHEVRDRLRTHARGARGARPHVAGAHPGRAAPRPLRLATP